MSKDLLRPGGKTQTAATRRGVGVTICLTLGVAVGLGLLLVPPAIIVTALMVIGIAMLVLRSPYLGLLLLLGLEYSRLQELIAGLRPLHIPRLLTLWVAVAWLLSMVGTGRVRITRDRQNAVMVGIVLVAGLSLVSAYWPGMGARVLIDLVKKMVSFLLILNLAGEQKRLRWVVWTIILLNVWLCLNQIGAYREAIPGHAFVRVGGGTDSFLGNTIDFAVALAVVLPIALFMALAERRPALRVTAALATILFIAAIVNTGSRAGALGLAALFGVFYLKTPNKILGLVGFLLLVLCWWSLSPQAYKERVFSIGDYQQDASVVRRIEAWHAAREMIRDHPLIGVGIGNFGIAYGVAYSPPAEKSRWMSVHNVLYQAAAELGLLGLVVYTLLGCFIIGDNRWTRRLSEHMLADCGSWHRNIAHGLDASLIGYLVTSMFATTLYYPHLYIIAGMAAALKHSALAVVAEGSAT